MELISRGYFSACRPSNSTLGPRGRSVSWALWVSRACDHDANASGAEVWSDMLHDLELGTGRPVRERILLSLFARMKLLLSSLLAHQIFVHVILNTRDASQKKEVRRFAATSCDAAVSIAIDKNISSQRDERTLA